MRDVKRKGFPEGTSSSSTRGKFHCYTFKVDIYSENEYRDHFNSKAHDLELVCREEKVLWRRSRSPIPDGRWCQERDRGVGGRHSRVPSLSPT